MRQRKAKDLENRLRSCGEYLLQPEGKKTNRSTFRTDRRGAEFCGDTGNNEKKYFDNDRELFLEIGCGKGNFIIKKALENPDSNFLAIEGQETVILRALEKAAQLQLPNLKFMLTFVHNMSELFYEGQLAGIYLNFSDPWPKARHAKRRLTHRSRLQDYGWALKNGGFLEFKTDNDALYDFSLEEIEATGYQIIQQTRNLHSSDFDARLTTTEYEDRFKSAGKNINYVKIIV